MEKDKRTDREMLDEIERQIKRGNTLQFIQTAITVIGFLGILTVADLIGKKK